MIDFSDTNLFCGWSVFSTSPAVHGWGTVARLFFLAPFTGLHEWINPKSQAPWTGLKRIWLWFSQPRTHWYLHKFSITVFSSERAKFDSPTQRVGLAIRLFLQALKGRNRLCRPFRAWISTYHITQRIALGYRISHLRCFILLSKNLCRY
jgi:hypothetical protein